MANAAFRDVSFNASSSHNEQVAKILSDPEASENDKYVALTFLRNAELLQKAYFILARTPVLLLFMVRKGQQVWTGYSDEEARFHWAYIKHTLKKTCVITECASEYV
ncbi:hypothetical protein [Bacteroides acidifaciens]|uniref:hypothetical protein n=1 Tax=Bacteroides acidifaciens TaxID=85831 RepID=UPI003F693FC5